MTFSYKTSDISRFLNHQMEEQEKLAFTAAIKDNPTLLKEVFYHKTINTAAQNLNKKRLKETLQRTKEDFYQKVLEQDNDKPIYTIDELKAFFKPENELEAYMKGIKKMAGVRRGGETTSKQLSITVIEPDNEANVEDTITFKIKSNCTFELELHILDNIRKSLHKVTIDAANDNISVPLTLQYHLADIDSDKPGRYYWLIKAKNRQKNREYAKIIGVFYVRKDLMP